AARWNLTTVAGCAGSALGRRPRHRRGAGDRVLVAVGVPVSGDRALTPGAGLLAGATLLEDRRQAAGRIGVFAPDRLACGLQLLHGITGQALALLDAPEPGTREAQRGLRPQTPPGMFVRVGSELRQLG